MCPFLLVSMKKRTNNYRLVRHLIDQPADDCMIADENYDVDDVLLPSSEKENVDIGGTNELSVGLQAVFNDMNERLKKNELVGLRSFSRVIDLGRKK